MRRLILIKTLTFRKKHIFSLLTIIFLVLAGLKNVSAFYDSSSVTSWSLADRTIVIDPGHGGIDPGAVGHNGVLEKDIVLQVAQRLKKDLNHAGARVVMTRESDEDLSTPGNGGLLKRKREDLKKRVELAHKNNADLYLSIHVNAFPSSRWCGAQTFYQKGQPESKRLAESIQSKLRTVLGNTTRIAKAEDFYTTRNTKMASVIVEIGFISNPAEARLMRDPGYQRKLSYAIYSGVVKYYTESR